MYKLCWLSERIAILFFKSWDEWLIDQKPDAHKHTQKWDVLFKWFRFSIRAKKTRKIKSSGKNELKHTHKKMVKLDVDTVMAEDLLTLRWHGYCSKQRWLSRNTVFVVVVIIRLCVYRTKRQSFTEIYWLIKKIEWTKLWYEQIYWKYRIFQMFTRREKIKIQRPFFFSSKYCSMT